MGRKQHDPIGTLFVVVWRFASGQHLDGRKRGDATFLADGTTADPHWWGFGGDPWWALRAGWKRAAIRWACVGAITGMVWWRPVTSWILVLAGGPLAGVYAVRCFRRWQQWQHYRLKVRPLAWSLVPLLGQPAAKPRSWLHVPEDYATNPDAEIKIDVPDDFTGADRDIEDITRAVTAKLTFPSPEVAQKLSGRAPCLIFRHQDPPPPSVSLDDIRADVEAAKPSEIILGLARKRQVTRLDLDSETPHGGISMTTGCGKSELAKNEGAQVAYHGGILMILDYKLVSHMWADGLPNVCYARTPAEIHEALLWLAWDEIDEDGNVIKPSELTRRKEVVLAATREGREPSPGPRLFIIAEERNATTRVLKRHWKRMGGKGTSPALEALDETGETGRQIGVNILYIAQRLSAKASSSDGSGDARENIGAIITKDPTEATWKMLANGHAQPPKSGHPGRYQLITRSGVTEYQGVLYDADVRRSDAIARELAMAGVVGVPRFDMPFVNRGGLLVPAGIGQGEHARQESAEQGTVITTDAPVLTPGQGPREAIKLAEAVSAGLFVSIAAARKAASRQHWEPIGGNRYTGYEYKLADIYEYKQARKK